MSVLHSPVLLPGPPASARRRLLARASLVLAATLLLHLWALDHARTELAFELPPPNSTVQAELFTLPAQIAVAAAAPPTAPRRRSAPAPSGVTQAVTPAAGPAVPAGTLTDPTAAATPAVPENDPAPVPDPRIAGPVPDPSASPTAESAPASPLNAVMVSFPKLGRFVSDTSLIRGLLRVFGTTTIEWKIGADRYESRSTTVGDDGRTLLTLVSSGDVRPDVGIAPLRYTEQRLGRAAQAVNFQWDARKVTFSASSAEFPLRDGVQDQLSFMAQLALLAQAFPDRFKPGMPIAMEVAGTRNVRVYDFRVAGWEDIRAGDRIVEALKLDRVIAPEAGDPRIELWLAPSLRWLPARTRTTLPDGSVVETVLREAYLE